MQAILRLSAVLLLAGSVTTADAAIRTWPGPAPCAGTLQDCLIGSTEGDVILVADNGPIAGGLTIPRPLTVRAAPGYRPVIAAGGDIGGSIDASGNWLVHIEGFTLLDGNISLHLDGSGEADIVIRDNRFDDSVGSGARIGLTNAVDAELDYDYEISRNSIEILAEASGGGLRSGMQVVASGSGLTRGRIMENRVTARGANAHGIFVGSSGRAHGVALQGNQIIGGRQSSIWVREEAAGGGALQVFVSNNFARAAEPGTRAAGGLRFTHHDGVLQLQAYHNTVVDAVHGVEITTLNGAPVSGDIVGNIFADLDRGIALSTSPSAIQNSRNLFFQTFETPSTPNINADSVFADPRMRNAPTDPRLAPDSPAIDAVFYGMLRSQMQAQGLPELDADGLRRVKRLGPLPPLPEPPVLDLGAFEAGDTTFVKIVESASTAPNQVFFDPSLDGKPDAAPQLTSTWNPDARDAGVYHDHPLSAVYALAVSRWAVRNDDLDGFDAGAAFNVFAPALGNGRYVHNNTSANTSGSITELDDASINNREDMILLVTRNVHSGAIDNLDSPIAVNYFSGTWSIGRNDGAPMPTSGGFSVYAQPPSLTAFSHAASAGNIANNVSFLKHALLDGKPCARLHVTQVSDGVVNNHHVGVFYNTTVDRWAVFNQDIAPMPVGARFHLVIDPQSLECPAGIFADGFESP